MAAYGPLLEGIPDWNTSRAVWAVNEMLRPDEFAMMWTVDELFLLYVGNEYEHRN